MKCYTRSWRKTVTRYSRTFIYQAEPIPANSNRLRWVRQLSDQVQEAKANYSTKAEQQTTTAADIKKLHHAIQQQGEVANKKISAIEQKYQTLRKINLALEVCPFLLFFAKNRSLILCTETLQPIVRRN